MTETAIELVDLNVRSPERTILSGVSLSLPSRGLIGLIGPMGSGKSTLFQFLSGGLAEQGLTADFKEARCHGHPYHSGNCAALFAQRPREAAMDAESSARLAKFRLHLLTEELQQSGQVLCVDEPTAGLLEADAEAVLTVLLELAKDRLVLMATHQMNLISPEWRRVILLGGGRILADCDTETFLAGKSGPDVEHFRQTHGLVIPREGTEIHALDPKFRTLPHGLLEDLLPAGDCGWIIPNKFWYASEPKCSCCIWQADTEFQLSDSCLKRTGADAQWVTLGLADEEAVVKMAKDITDVLAQNRTVLLRTMIKSDLALRLLGALFICLGVAPDKAGAALARRSKLTDFGLEQFLWDLDLRLALELN